MNCPLQLAKPLAYWLVVFGCLLAVVTAFEPVVTGAYHLDAGFLVCGLIPYIVYGSFTDILDGCTLVMAGCILLAMDLGARLVFNITSAAQHDVLIAVWLCTLLVLAILPAGILIGKLLGRMLTCCIDG